MEKFLLGQNADTVIDIPWFSEPLMNLSPWLQWTFFTLTSVLGGFLEFSANTSFLWPCWSELATSINASYMMAFYWMMFQETETSRYIIMFAIYATDLILVIATDGCGSGRAI